MIYNNSFLRTLGFVVLLGGGTVAATSCSEADKQEVSAESDQAYNDLATFVSNSEARADAAADEMQADYDRETTEMAADYEAKKAAVEKNIDKYDDARKKEIDDLNNRYTAASEKRTTNWTNRTKVGEMGQYYKPMSPAAQITAANAKATYSSFVDNVVANKEKYDINDWRNVNAEWRALDEAYDKVKGDIPAGDLASIQKEKLKYAGVKSWDKTKLRASQGADAVAGEANDVADDAEGMAQNVKEETADERSRAGQAISNTASDVKEAGKDVGQGAASFGKKVGMGAAEVGKDIGQGAAKAGKKVGGAVKDVFDGKDDDKK